MSGRVATPPPSFRRSRAERSLLVLGLLAAAGTVCAAQPPAPDDRDGRSPRPPDESSRPVAALKYQVPNKDRAIFRGHLNPKTGLYSGGITDFEPIATEVSNKLEYDAWHVVTQHAAQFSSRELEDHAGRDATRDELILPARTPYRLELLRFDGKLTKIRRIRRVEVAAGVGYTGNVRGAAGPPR